MARILVIDDEAPIREIIVSALQHVGHAVTSASSGKEGSKLLRSQPADLVITDIVMPDQDGIETITRIRKDHPGMAIIAMSGTSTHSALYLKIANQLGAREVLQKPFSLTQLIQVTNEVLAKSAPPPPTE